jgi:hypothetical protein
VRSHTTHFLSLTHLKDNTLVSPSSCRASPLAVADLPVTRTTLSHHHFSTLPLTDLINEPLPSLVARRHPLGVLIVMEKTLLWGSHRRAVSSNATARGRCAATVPGHAHDALAPEPLWSMGWDNSASHGPQWRLALCGWFKFLFQLF